MEWDEERYSEVLLAEWAARWLCFDKNRACHWYFDGIFIATVYVVEEPLKTNWYCQTICIGFYHSTCPETCIVQCFVWLIRVLWYGCGDS